MNPGHLHGRKFQTAFGLLRPSLAELLNSGRQIELQGDQREVKIAASSCKYVILQHSGFVYFSQKKNSLKAG